MPREPLDLTVSPSGLNKTDLPGFIEEWLLESQLRQLSPATLATRRDFLGKLSWFVERGGYVQIGTSELRAFLLYLSNGHEENGGRFGNPLLTKPLQPISVHGYFRVLRGFFNWLEEEGMIEGNPMKRLKAPVARTETKQPIAAEHITALLQAARNSSHKKRNEALLLLLLDTGLRASEVCSLKVEDIDLTTRSFRVCGKGNKIRVAYFGQATLKSLVSYLRSRRAEPREPLFASRTGGALTANSLRQLTERLARVAGVPPSQCSPHAFRRTFAVSILRAGANLFSVQAMLGHTDLQMTRRYVSLAEADVESQHRQFSPVDKLAVDRLASNRSRSR